MKKEKKLLIYSILLDLVGMVSFIIPVFGELSDIIWAPISGWLLMRMYKGTSGKVGGVIAMAEEIFPFTDFIPTFTLMWLYTYLFKSEDTDNGRLMPIRVKSN